MITGEVNADREATIRLNLLNSNGATEEILAVIDTGFSGDLTLPPDKIAHLGYSFLMRSDVILGNGTVETVDVFRGRIEWDGKPIAVEIDAADTEPLIGMGLVYGYELNIEAVDGGAVTLKRLRTP
jgi:clan AA aspartic protease